MRNRAVSDLLGAEGGFGLPGHLRLGEKEFPLELVEYEGGRFVKGSLDTTFEAFEVEVPTIAGGLIARPHEELELIVHLDLTRVEGLLPRVRAQGFH